MRCVSCFFFDFCQNIHITYCHFKLELDNASFQFLYKVEVFVIVHLIYFCWTWTCTTVLVSKFSPSKSGNFCYTAP